MQNTKPSSKNKKSAPGGPDADFEKKLMSEMPLSEKDEVKRAEQKTNKAVKK